jgi:two-component system cell cycle response regulator DivK
MGSPQRVLIVEDNLDNLAIYTTILEFKGFVVLSATDGAKGIAIARAEKPDLILMDVSVPVIDGWEATRTLKADETTKAIPIVMLTAHALEVDRVRAFAEGANGFIPKPAEPMAVVNEIRRTLTEPGYSVGVPGEHLSA